VRPLDSLVAAVYSRDRIPRCPTPHAARRVAVHRLYEREDEPVIRLERSTRACSSGTGHGDHLRLHLVPHPHCVVQYIVPVGCFGEFAHARTDVLVVPVVQEAKHRASGPAKADSYIRLGQERVPGGRADAIVGESDRQRIKVERRREPDSPRSRRDGSQLNHVCHVRLLLWLLVVRGFSHSLKPSTFPSLRPSTFPSLKPSTFPSLKL